MIFFLSCSVTFWPPAASFKYYFFTIFTWYSRVFCSLCLCLTTTTYSHFNCFLFEQWNRKVKFNNNFLQTVVYFKQFFYFCSKWFREHFCDDSKTNHSDPDVWFTTTTNLHFNCFPVRAVHPTPTYSTDCPTWFFFRNRNCGNLVALESVRSHLLSRNKNAIFCSCVGQ